MTSLLITGGTVVTSEGEVKRDVLVENGIITMANEPMAHDQAIRRCDATGKLLFPGLIDCHVHFREPGLTHKGDMQSESRAAIAGGVTTVCDMPNTVPPTTSVAALKDKIRRAASIQDCDIRFFFGATDILHLQAFREAWETPELRRHLVGLKIYFDHSTGDQGAEIATIEEAFRICAELQAPLVGHCEDAAINNEALEMITHASKNSDVSLHSLMRPAASEVKAIENALALVRKYRTPFHVAHLSTGQGADLVRRAKAEGLPVTCEVAPHHLFLSTDDYKELGTFGKMNPPLRTPDELSRLWEAIADGTIDCIATDHAPHTLEEKQNSDWMKTPGGVPGVETMLPLLLTIIAEQWPSSKKLFATRYSLTAQDLLRLCFTNPNRIFKLGKQGMTEGAPADFCIVDPKAECTICAKDLHSKCGWTPFEGMSVLGRVERMIGRYGE